MELEQIPLSIQPNKSKLGMNLPRELPRNQNSKSHMCRQLEEEVALAYLPRY
jgi:hypothetical protein